MSKRDRIFNKLSDYFFNVSVVFLAGIAIKDLIKGIEFNNVVGLSLSFIFFILGIFFIAISREGKNE